jgi:Ca2+-binding EF-hand superfamily protein/RNA polymerase subunit RPABC4/transcription elongation factor Spt4
MSDDKTDENPMAECGSCRAVIPLNSKDCPECGIQFSGVSDESLGECGACNSLVPLDSKSCPKCGVYFVADDVVDVLRKWFSETGIEVSTLFQKMDLDGDGSIDAEELKDGLLKLNLADLPPSQVDRLVEEFDTDNDGRISLEELVFTITGEEISQDSEGDESETDSKADALKEFSENVLVRVMEKYSITQREEFLSHAQDYDSNDNGYLTEGELKAAAEAFSTTTRDAEDSEDSIDNSEQLGSTDDDSEQEIVGDESKEVISEELADEVEEMDISEDAEEEISDDESEGDLGEVVSETDDSELSPLHRLGIAASQDGMTIREVFEAMDSDHDGLIDGPELQNGIQELSGDRLSPNEIYEILQTLDEDSDGRVNPMELVNALEELDIGLDSDRTSGMRDPMAILVEAMDDAGTNPGRVFKDLDKNGDGSINIEELRSEVESFIGERLSDYEMDNLFDRLDDDGNGYVDIIEFVDNLEDYDEEDDDEAALSSKVEFPSKMQSRLMSKKWNDVFWPLIHTALFIFIVMWIVNGSLAPFVSGEEGNIELNTESGMFNDGDQVYLQGDIYPCDDSVQIDGCKNSLTPLAGEDGASSMPAGFYWDGVLFIILGSIGFVGSLFTHLFIVPGWRARARAIRDSEKERQEVDDDIENDGESEKEGEEDLEEDSEDNSDDFEEDLEDDNIEESEEDYEDEESDDDDIDVGSHIGLVLDDEEVFGVIVEFDDDEGLVTIEEDGTGDLVTGYQDSMFIED